MTQPISAREALIVEAIGELQLLLDRLEAVAPALEAASKELGDVSAGLAGQADAIEARIATCADAATALAVKHVARQAHEIARAASCAEAQAMQTAGRALFQAELGPTLQLLAGSINTIQRRASMWQAGWGAIAITAVTTSALTWVLGCLVLPR